MKEEKILPDEINSEIEKINIDLQNKIDILRKKSNSVENKEERKKINEKLDELDLKNSKEKYDRKEELEWKLSKLKKLKKRYETKKKLTYLIIILPIFIVIFTFFIENKIPIRHLIITRCIFIFYSFFGILLSILKNDTFIIEEMKEVSDELDYLTSKNKSEEIKAEKQFKMYQNELQKYYSQNLSHSKKIFSIGILSICLGFLIIGYTLWILSLEKEINNSIQLVITGGIGGILSNFIGVIYLKMYSENLKVLTEFHSKLVYTHNLHFSNCLLAKIKDKNLKEKVLQDAILSIVKKERVE